MFSLKTIVVQDGVLPSGKATYHSPTMSLTSVDKEDAGTYTCTASNGVGTPATAVINLRVLCKKNKEEEKNTLKNVALSYQIFSNPKQRYTFITYNALLFKIKKT